MNGCGILCASLFFGYAVAASDDIQVQLYKRVDCVEGDTIIDEFETPYRRQCGFACTEKRGAGFSYDSSGRECRIFKAMFKNQSYCGVSSNIYVNVDVSVFTPTLRDYIGYTVKHPFLGNNSLARFRCTSFHDVDVIESCPISRVEEFWTPASLSCSEKDIFDSSSVYKGKVTCTVRGVTCQRWDSSTPHEPLFYVNRTDLHNWCQTSGEARPWCYTTDPATRWDYCPVEEFINCGEPSSIVVPGINLTIEWPYSDTMSIARYRCAKLVHTQPVPSCPVTQCRSDGTWSTAHISCSDSDCYDPNKQTYNGLVTCTWTGITCQRWDTDYPHMPNINFGRSDLGNRCVIEDKEKPWCFTSDPSLEWDFCPYLECV